MRPIVEPKVGQRVYRFGSAGDGQPCLSFANYVHKRGPWRRYRNITTGEEWNENGLNWWLAIGEALQSYIRLKAWEIADAATMEAMDADIQRIVTAVWIAEREHERIRR